MCLNNQGGYISLGGFPQGMHLEGERVQKVKYVSGSNYKIKVHGIYVGGESDKEVL
jgi:hypothetical protein